MTRDELIDAYRGFGAVVFRRCRQILGNEQDSRDASQEIFERCLRRCDELRPGPELLSWLYRVSTNLCLDRLRTQRHGLHTPLQDDLPGPESSNGESRMLDRDSVRRLFGAVEKRTREVAVYLYRRHDARRGREGQRDDRPVGAQPRRTPARGRPPSRTAGRIGMSNQCPSSFALDAFRLGLDRTPAAHVRGCSRCAVWLAAQEQLEAKVAHLWVPAAPRPRRTAPIFWRWVRLGLPVAVGMAALILLARPRQPTETAKGPPPLVEIARSRAGVLSWLSPADELAAKDAIRIFVNRQDRPDRYVLVGSVDGSGQLARFYPMDGQGCSVPLPAAGEAIDGSIVIDEAPGPERLVVLVSHEPLCWPTVGDAVRRFALGAPLPADLLSNGLHATRLVLPKRLGTDR